MEAAITMTTMDMCRISELPTCNILLLWPLAPSSGFYSWLPPSSDFVAVSAVFFATAFEIAAVDIVIFR
jgi:hypothetical protein